MANSEHVKIARAGKQAIEDWRRENPGSVMDLSGADLSYRSFKRTDFSGANCRNTDFMGCDLRLANFEGSDLTKASLFRAVTTHANFRGADLEGTTIVPQSTAVNWWADDSWVVLNGTLHRRVDAQALSDGITFAERYGGTVPPSKEVRAELVCNPEPKYMALAKSSAARRRTMIASRQVGKTLEAQHAPDVEKAQRIIRGFTHVWLDDAIPKPDTGGCIE